MGDHDQSPFVSACNSNVPLAPVALSVLTIITVELAAAVPLTPDQVVNSLGVITPSAS